jgi:hypothetical protein
MSTTTELQADREEIYRAVRERRRPNPEVAQRVHERARKVREEIFRTHGLLNMAVDLIRATRDA